MSERTDGIATELLALRDADGKIIPRHVVAWARKHRRSRLYAQLEWDDAVAGERFRVWQVRELIAIHVVESGPRRFISLSIDRNDGGYRALDQVMERPDLKEIMLADALHELERIQRRYERLNELSAVWEAAGTVRRRRAAVTSQAAAE